MHNKTTLRRTHNYVEHTHLVWLLGSLAAEMIEYDFKSLTNLHILFHGNFY